jgi:phosphoribosyl-ATP pyrophosphohydrolase/phosphoribosyl-AMP cyclohydrolase
MTATDPLADPHTDPLLELFAVITDRRDRPKEGSYTCQLFAGGDNKILKKIGEESAEVVMACKDNDPDAIAAEVADLFYHTLVALAHHHVDLNLVYEKLAARR